MGKELKVYAWDGAPPQGVEIPGHTSGRSVIFCVAAPSRAAGLRAAGCDEREVNSSWARNYVGESGNLLHREVALSKPGTAFCVRAFTGKREDYVEVPR